MRHVTYLDCWQLIWHARLTDDDIDDDVDHDDGEGHDDGHDGDNDDDDDDDDESKENALCHMLGLLATHLTRPLACTF